MVQAKGQDEPPPQAEGGLQPAADAPADDATPMEEEKPVTGDDEPAAAAGAADPVMGPASTEGAGAEEEDAGAGRSVDPAAGASGEADKMENGNGAAKADGENMVVDGQNQPADDQLVLVTPAEEDLASAKVSNNFFFDYSTGGDDSGTEEEQAAFMKELERFYKEKMMEFKPPKFYGEGLNCLKLWRQVTGLGGYDQVTSCKLWRQVGESFKPPKTCTTVSWTFRNFYEKALLEYEKHKIETGEFHVATSTLSDRIGSESQISHASSSGRARRESATRAMQGWHSQRMLGNGEIADPIIKDKGAVVLKKDKTPKTSGPAKRKKMEDDRVVPYKSDKIQ